MNPYIKFLHQIREISKLDEFPRMTPLSKLIFDQVALYEAMGNPLAVREMLSFNEIASPATIHKHLSALRRSGWHSPNSVDKYYCQNLNGRNANAKSQIHS
jgi:SOS-response transcriptional repressor LexA